MITYTYNLSDFKNNKVCSDRLTNEIRSSEIIISLDHIDTDPISTYLFFKDSLSNDDKLLLDNIINEHSGEPLPPTIPIVRAEILTEQSEYVLNGNIVEGFYCAESIVLNLGVSSVETLDLIWGFDISLKCATIHVNEQMLSDEMEIIVSPNTLVGALTSNLNTGDTILYVSDTVIKNVKKGWYIGLYGMDGNSTEIGRIINISTDHIVIDRNSTISAQAGTYICTFVKILPYLYFNAVSKIEIGKSIPTGQRVQKDTIIRIKYYNNNKINGKKVSFFIEYLY